MKQENSNSGKPGISYIRDEKGDSGSSIGSTIVMLAIVVMSLVLLKFETNRTANPQSNINIDPVNYVTSSSSPKPVLDDTTSAKTSTNTGSADSLKYELNRNETEIIQKRMKQILAATKKVSFKARILTESGFKGFWTQNKLSYRFEDPIGSQAIIFNADKRRLWVIDLTKNIAFETKFNDESVDAYSEFSLAMFLETLTSTSDTSKKDLEEILPAGDKAKLKFNAIGLPIRWEGVKSDGAATFIAWDYTKLADVPPADFELPEGVVVKSLTSSQIEPDR